MTDQLPVVASKKADFFCCEFSRQVGEQLFGTAPRAEVWLALEYSQSWDADAFPSSDLSEAVKRHLSASLDAIPAARLQLIRQRESDAKAVKTLYVALSRESAPTLYKFQITDYEELLSLDIAAIASGDPVYQPYISQQPVYLVCANGKRDRSCAKFGLPLYTAVAEIVGDAAWQTTHLGGHRFAANIVALPYGLCYGWVDPGEAQTVISETEHGRIFLEKYRGRSCYAEVAQAADYYLRAQTGENSISSFRLRDVQSLTPTSWTVHFESLTDGKTHRVRITQAPSAFEIYKSSTDVNGVHVPQFQLVEYEAER